MIGCKEGMSSSAITSVSSSSFLILGATIIGDRVGWGKLPLNFNSYA